MEHRSASLESLTSVRERLASAVDLERVDQAQDALAEALAEQEYDLASLTATALSKAAPALTLEPREEDDPSLEFELAPGMRATVIEETRAVMSARMRYRLELRSDTHPQRLRVGLTDFEYLEINGEDATKADKKLRLARARTAAAAIPELIVTTSGELVSLGETGRMQEALESLGAPSSRERLETLQPLLAKSWYAWFASWRGFPTGPTAVHGELDGRHLLVGGGAVRVPLAWARSQRPRVGATQQLFELGSTLKATGHGEALARAVTTYASDAAGPERAASRLLGAMEEAELRLLAVFEEDTRLPAVVGRVARGAASSTRGPLEAAETQLWSFEWDG